jgi:membrane protein implicated in regulation of membrane protease activity
MGSWRTPAHRWAVYVYLGFMVVAAVWLAIDQDIAAAIGMSLFLGFILAFLSWDFVRKANRSDDPDTYGLRDFVRETWEED